MIKTGDIFTATDKQGRSFIYQFDGINPDDNSREIVLQNLTSLHETCVEAEWSGREK